jgi:hypothetical protein
MPNQPTTKEPLVLVSKQAGVTVIPSESLLTRLNYFDGKFLRAEDLRAEQQYLRYLVQLSNQAGGHGVAHGYTVGLAAGGDTLNVGPGLAIDPAGRVLLMPQPVSVSVQQLIDQSQELLKIVGSMKAGNGGGGFSDCEFVAGEPPTNVPQAGDLYLITISHAEAYCGQAEIFGKLCEEACVTSTDRPFVVEGVVLRAVPLTLQTPLPQSSAVFLNQQHLRSRVASAYFNDERLRIQSLISKAGLDCAIWCFGAEPAPHGDVPIAVIARAGQSTIFLDAWTARRELIDTQARRYWQWRMRMRPWDVFLAHVLQFQCQLHELFKTTPDPGSDDPCLNERQVIAEAAGLVQQLNAYFADVSAKLASLNLPDPNAVKAALGLTQENFAKYTDLGKKLDTVKDADFTGKLDHLLINGGIVELPSGGYLPVAPSSTVSVNKQVRAMLGDGVDLRFCVVRPDYPAHALEEVQHMERISLLEGLDNPEKKPEVDILVPEGEIITSEQAAPGGGFEADVTFSPVMTNFLGHLFQGELDFNVEDNQTTQQMVYKGAARAERLSNGGGALHLATLAQLQTTTATSTTDTLMNEAALNTDAKTAPARVRGRKGGAKGKLADMQPEATPNAFKRVKESVFNTVRNSASFDAPAEFGAPREGRFTAAAVVGSNQQFASGLWFTMKSDVNIFALAQNDTAGLDLRSVIAAPSGQSKNYIDTRLHGELTVDQVQDVAGERVVVGRVPIMASFDLDVGGEAGHESSTEHFKLEARLKTSGQGHIITLKLTRQKEPLGFQITIDLGGDPLAAAFEATYFNARAGSETLMLSSDLLSNPAVSEPANPSHAGAVSGLQLLANALGDPGFFNASSKLLFPPAPPSGGEMLVRATRDWVLFHRRRTRRCEVEVQPQPQPPQPAQPARRYNVLHVAYGDKIDGAGGPAFNIDDLRGDLPFIKPEEVKEFIKPAGQVEFGGGVETLNTAPADVLSAWQAAQPGGTLFYGVIISKGEAIQDGEALALGRLESVGQVIGSVTTMHPQAQFDTMTEVPAAIDATGVDGVILLVTVNETVRHVVFRFGFPGGIEVLRKELMSGQPLSEVLLDRAEAEKVGEVTFVLDSPTTVPDNSLNNALAEWAERDALVGASLVVSRTGDPNVSEGQQQFAFIANKFGKGPNFNQQPLSTSGPIPDGCRFASFINPDFKVI